MKKILLAIMLMAPIATFAQKFGKINTQTIMQALPDIAKVNGELQAQQKTYENDLKGMQDELTRQNEAYEKGKSTMNPTQQKQKEQVELCIIHPRLPPQFSCPSSASSPARPCRRSAGGTASAVGA